MADSIKLLEKFRDKERRIYKSQKKEILVDDKIYKTSDKKGAKTTMINKLSFSDIYAKKL